MNQVRNLVLFGLISFSMVSCLSSPSKSYYEIRLLDSSVISSGSKVKKRLILLKDIEVNDFYDDYRLVYRESKYELNYYTYDFWTSKPDKLLKKELITYMNAVQDRFVIRDEFDDRLPAYFIECQVEAIEEVDRRTGRFGRLSMLFKLFDNKNGKLLFRFSFDDVQRYQENRVSSLPRAISIVLKRNIDQFIKKMTNYILEETNDKKN